jgi:hypothetical protein
MRIIGVCSLDKNLKYTLFSFRVMTPFETTEKTLLPKSLHLQVTFS